MTEVEGPTLPEGVPVDPSPPKRAQKKRKEAPSIAASPSSNPEGHVSAVAFFLSFDDGPHPSSPRAYIWLLASECRLDGHSSV
jgi:hypothetical protein